jgi:hypothetical protein
MTGGSFSSRTTCLCSDRGGLPEYIFERLRTKCNKLCNLLYTFIFLTSSSAGKNNRGIQHRMFNSNKVYFAVFSLFLVACSNAQLQGAGDQLPEAQCPSSPNDRQLELDEVSEACGT